jgi:hypothetical protein
MDLTVFKKLIPVVLMMPWKEKAGQKAGEKAKKRAKERRRGKQGSRRMSE